MSTQTEYKVFQGASLFRQRITFATLMHTSIEIDHIRDNGSDEAGLADYEINYLKMIDSLTNGSVIEINEEGTRIRYKPGTITGSLTILRHECTLSRGISYWLESLLLILPFAKTETRVELDGCTYHELDVSVDIIRGVVLPSLKKHFGIDCRIDLKRRALAPSGGGHVRLSVPVIRQMHAIDHTEIGMIKRIRGLCYTIAMAPTIANRIRQSANNVLYKLISDVWIFNDKTSKGTLTKHVPKEYKNRVSAGCGLSLIAESTTGVLTSIHKENDMSTTAEEFGESCAKALLQEISYGSTVDLSTQALFLILMALARDVSRIRLGRLSQHSVHVLRLIRDMMGVTFKIKEDPRTGTIFASCFGIGFLNVWRQAS